MRKLTLSIILLLSLLILSISVTAQSTEYLTWGVSRDNTFQTDGTGVWPRVASTYQRTENITSRPLVQDINNDGFNDIIVVKDTSLTIYNYTTGVGLIEQASFDFSTSQYSGGQPFYQTPGLFDYDSDNLTEIIVFNFTHMLTLEFNETGSLVLEQSATTSLTGGGGNDMATYPVIKCAPGNLWNSNNDTCALVSVNRTATMDPGVITYDLDVNAVRSVFGASVPNTNDRQYNTHIADGDADGFYEIYFALHDTTNDDLDLHVVNMDSDGQLAIVQSFSHNLAGSVIFTDIIVNNLDGNPADGLEITWGFTSDGTNWDAYTISIDAVGAATTIQSSYCSALTCPEGEAASLNLVEASDTTYCDFSGDVYYYVRNANNNDPGTDTDTVHCISLFAGAGTEESEISNTQNFTEPFFIHQTQMYSATTGILTSLYGVQSITKQSLPTISSQQWLIPVDYQQSGSVDIIGVDEQASIIYYDDGFTNQNMQIDSLDFDTANPICRGEILGLTIDVSDDLNNVGYCHVQELFPNLTQKSIQSNTSVTPPATTTLNYFADEAGTFPLRLRCRDQFHTAYDTQTYTVIVINDTATCNFKGEGGGSVSYEPSNATIANTQFTQNWNDALADVGVVGGVMKGIIWLIAILVAVGGVAFAAARVNMPADAIVALSSIMLVGMLILGWYFDMISAVPLVMFGLLMAAIIGFKAFSSSSTGGG